MTQYQPAGQVAVPAYGSYYNQRGYNYQYANWQKNTMKADYVAKAEGDKKNAWINYVFLALFIVGIAMVAYGFVSVSPVKISENLNELASGQEVTIAIICDPCTSAQETALIGTVGLEDYKGQVDNKFFARATKDQIDALAQKQWVKFITQVE